jgi:hypothetical protein
MVNFFFCACNEIAQARQPVDRGHIVARDTVLCSRGGVGGGGRGLEMRKKILTLYPTKLKQNAQAILKIYQLFVMDTYITLQIHCIKRC